MASPCSLFTKPFPIAFVLLLLILNLCWKSEPSVAGHAAADIQSVEVVNEFPHDRRAFTEGLVYGGSDTLFESVGLYGESSVRKVFLRTGKVEVLQKMNKSYFGEGLTLLGGRLFQVTWQTRIGFKYDRNNLSKFVKFKHYMKDGWGLATNGFILFGSDGTSTLYQMDSRTFKVLRKQKVKYKGREVYNLNELEFMNGEILANIWLTDCIARISVKDGSVLGWIFLSNLRERLVAAGAKGIDVLNGIAWDYKQKRLFGKLWPKLYEIKLQPMRKPLNGSIEHLCMPHPSNFSHQ
ncbi:glutaminyl-peptide cyclotransferase-like isoform X2 [Malania oleifera]|uniref:glutaminyl-peptide cyclotransferase-like isoform X2 n=1 Tax=Malania oleifera TaxID=397392 RepID=UPI0025ADA4DE|nr:glutaminyl-peptide cyclotransferase-like isoform X2 [Malania oleifera]